MKYDHWQSTIDHFDAWWRNDCIDRPVLRIVAKRETPLEPLEPEAPFDDPRDRYLNVEKNLIRKRNHLRTHRYLAEAFPSLSLNLGAGSMALYLGCQPEFRHDTIWFHPCLDTIDAYMPAYDPKAYWWVRHLDMIRQARQAAGEDFLIDIPDIVEDVDIYAAMRGPMASCFDLMDQPDEMQRVIQALGGLFMAYYDAMYDMVKTPEGISSFTAFSILGRGKTAKIQCDFSALMSPEQFRRFAIPGLKAQTQRLDNTLYHLDGPDAIKHADALMELEGLNALQWTSGAGHPDGCCEEWFGIYDKVKAAGKALHLTVYDGGLQDWLRSCDRVVERYGPKGLFFCFPVMMEEEAQVLLAHAQTQWRG